MGKSFLVPTIGITCIFTVIRPLTILGSTQPLNTPLTRHMAGLVCIIPAPPAHGQIFPKGVNKSGTRLGLQCQTPLSFYFLAITLSPYALIINPHSLTLNPNSFIPGV